MSAVERVPAFVEAMEIVDYISDHVDRYGGDLEDLVSSQTKGTYADFNPAERALVIAALAQQDAAPRAAAACYLLGKGGVRDLEAFCALVDLSGEPRDYLLEVLHWAMAVGSRDDIYHLIETVADIEGLLASRPWWCVDVLEALAQMGPEAPHCLWRSFLTGTESDLKDAKCLATVARGIETYEDDEADYYHPYPLVLHYAGYFRGDGTWLRELLTTGSASALWLVADALLENDVASTERVFLSDAAFRSVEGLIARQPDAARREAMLAVATWARERLLRIPSRSQERDVDPSALAHATVGGKG